jgi:hypothetical protein
LPRNRIGDAQTWGEIPGPVLGFSAGWVDDGPLDDMGAGHQDRRLDERNWF